MLAKKNRLTGKENFKRVETQGKIHQSENFGLAFFDRGDKLPTRFAFKVSTKISKEASGRNRAKRAMSEGVRVNTIDLVDGFDVVFLAKTSITKSPTSDVMKEVKVALKGTGLSR